MPDALDVLRNFVDWHFLWQMKSVGLLLPKTDCIMQRDAFTHFIPIITVKDNRRPLRYKAPYQHSGASAIITQLITIMDGTKLEQSQYLFQSKISYAKNIYKHNLASMQFCQ